MRAITIIAATTLAAALPATAQTTYDADGDGNVSLEELQAVIPEITTDTFSTMDADEDGVLSGEELDAAIAAGLLPT